MKLAATLFVFVFSLVLGLSLASPSTQKPLSQSTVLLKRPANVSQSQVSQSQKAPEFQNLFYLMSAEIALDREQPQIALANYIAAAQETQDANIASRATQIALSVASLEVALEPALIWANADKNNLEAQITSAALLIRLKQGEKALPALQRAEHINALQAYQYYLVLFRQLQQENDANRVIEVLELLAKSQPSLSANLALAEIYLFRGDEKKALQYSTQAVTLSPRSIIGIELNAESLLKLKGKEPANTFLSKKIKETGDNLSLKQYYAQFLLENGYSKQAKSSIANLIQNPDISSEALLQFARMTMQEEWLDLSSKILHKTRERPDSQDLSHYFLARLAEMQNQSDKAINWYQQVLTGPFHTLSQIRASILLTEHKRFDEALKVLSHAQPHDNAEKKQIVLSIIDIYNKTERQKEAFSLLNENLSEMPDEIELRYARSIIADKLDRLDIAEEDLQSILRLQPGHLDALNALGYMLANKTTRYDEANQYLSKALRLSPENSSVLDSLGWLYYKMGDYQQALLTLKKAAALMPDAEIAAHLGEVMWKLNDFEGAKRVWKKALKLHPKNKNVLNVMNRFLKKQ